MLSSDTGASWMRLSTACATPRSGGSNYSAILIFCAAGWRPHPAPCATCARPSPPHHRATLLSAEEFDRALDAEVAAAITDASSKVASALTPVRARARPYRFSRQPHTANRRIWSSMPHTSWTRRLWTHSAAPSRHCGPVRRARLQLRSHGPLAALSFRDTRQQGIEDAARPDPQE